jgi:hypothetical protein
MNCKKILTGALALAGTMFFASAAQAQITNVVVGVGSSALFPTVGIAAVTPDPISGGAAPCGTNLWTSKQGSNGNTINGIDPRSGAAAEPGTIWIAWDTAGTTACAYLSVDSIVGQRLFFAQGTVGANASGANGTLQLVVPGNGLGNGIAGFPDTQAAPPPGAVVAALNGAHFNVAFTDIRPEDGQFAFFRAANSVANGGFNYNASCALVGTPVWSSFSNTNAQVDCFKISGTDPISGLSIPKAKTISLGASPVLLFISNNGNMAGGTLPTNILSKTAEKFFSGQIGSSQSVFGGGVVNAIMSEIQREPVSGTYNTFEFQLVHARDGSAGDSTQELNGGGTISPVPAQCFVGGAAFSACTNPMFINSGSNSIRYRAIGTGEMIKAVNGTTTVATTNPDRLGYAFYSLGSFYITGSHLKYLTLQGVDGLYPDYSANNGAFGTCTGSIPASTFQCTTTLPDFTNIRNGNYRVWSTLRAVVNTVSPLPPALATTLLNASQDQAAYALSNPTLGGISAPNTVIKAIADFVPANSFPGGVQTPFLNVFRSHYGISGIAANNGTTNPTTGFCAGDQTSPSCFEEGGDMAGVAFQTITDVNYFNITGSQLLTQVE